MSEDFQTIDLIEIIEFKKAIWDKSDETYKNKLLKEKQWKEVCSLLFQHFDEQNENERKITGEFI